MKQLLFLFLLPSTLFAQTWTTVAAPSYPLNFCSAGSNYTWSYPFVNPSPSGTYEISNAIVDKSHRVGAWSQPATITVKSGWHLYGGSWNQPPTSDEAGIAWKIKCIAVNETADFRNGSEHYLQTTYEVNSVTPWSGSSPELQPLYLMWQRFQTVAKLSLGGNQTTIANAPVIVPSSLPNVSADFAYTRVAETGETKLSPPYRFTPTVTPGQTPAETCQIQFTISEAHPQGTIGYHVYWRPEGGQWQRLPAPHCYGDPATPDDWLWQWWDKQPKVIRTVANAPVHKAAANPQSRLCDLQIQLKERTGNITVPSGVTYETYCPVIDEWRVEGIFYTFGRQIKAADGGRWWIKKGTSQAGHTVYPVVGVYNQYSLWNGLQSNGCLSIADWSGGQGFGVQFHQCSFGKGLLIHSRSAGSSLNLGGHTASELSFENCTFAGEVPIWIGGVQSANIRFSRTHATSNAIGRKGCSVYAETPNQIRFTGGFYTDCTHGGAIFRSNIYPANLLVDDIWVDQGFYCFFESSHTNCNVKFRGGKLNCWAHDPFEELTLVRLIDSPPSLSRIIFNDVAVQFNYTPLIDVISPHYNLCELRFEDSALAECVVLREPTKQQEQARANQIYPWGYPAVPTRQVPGFRLSSTSSVNSFTNRAKVMRENWTAVPTVP